MKREHEYETRIRRISIRGWTKIAWRGAPCMAMLHAIACGGTPPAAPAAETTAPAMSTPASSVPTRDASNAARAPVGSTTDAVDDSKPAGNPAIASAASAGSGMAAAADAGAATDSMQLPGAGDPCSDPTLKRAPEPASFTQIKGYETLTKEPTTGPERPVLESDPGLPEWTVYRPEPLEGASMRPILIWGNGGCLTNGTIQGQFLLEAASHGFVVFADGAPQAAGADPISGGIRQGGADGKPMLMVLDWLAAENERPCSPYYHELDLTKVAVAGQSCGGLMAEYASIDPRVTTVIINNSGLFSRDAALYSKMHAPMAFLIGGMTDIAYANAEGDIAAIDRVPIFNGNLDVGHAATWEEVNGGEFGRVALGWLQWKLQDDPMAQKMFAGADCELCTPPSMWVVKKKMMD
jgi:hypothetical protein